MWATCEKISAYAEADSLKTIVIDHIWNGTSLISSHFLSSASTNHKPTLKNRIHYRIFANTLLLLCDQNDRTSHLWIGLWLGLWIGLENPLYQTELLLSSLQYKTPDKKPKRKRSKSCTRSNLKLKSGCKKLKQMQKISERVMSFSHFWFIYLFFFFYRGVMR